MYEGYLIKIDSTTIANRYIDRTSWRITPLDRKVVDSFDDVTGVHHEYLSDHNRVGITFTLNEHRESEHSALASLFTGLTDVTVEYFNSLTGLYSTGRFRIDNPEWKHKRTFDDTIWYDSTNIKLTEY